MAVRYGYGSGDGDGSGYGSGYGSGDGSGDGYGSGYGYGYGYGSGDGYGYGYGDPYGYEYGYGDVAAVSAPERSVIAADLAKADACARGVRAFRKEFPNGAVWPTDIAAAEAAGLDVRWACKALGLPYVGAEP